MWLSVSLWDRLETALVVVGAHRSEDRQLVRHKCTTIGGFFLCREVSFLTFLFFRH